MVVKSVDGTHLPTGCGAPAAYLPAAPLWNGDCREDCVSSLVPAQLRGHSK